MTKKLYKIIDGSYALADRSGEMQRIDGIDLREDVFLMLAEHCALPTDPANLSPEFHRVNNVILRNVDTDQIVFTQKRFIRLIHPTCPTCGQIIEGV